MSTTRRILFAAAASIVLLAGATAQAQQSLRLAHHHAAGGQVDQTARKFVDLVKERSGGQIAVTVFPAAQLGQEREAFGLLNQGVIDMTFTSVGLMDQFYPPVAVTALPFVFRDWGHATRAFDGEFGQTLTASVAQRSNAQILGYIGLGFRDMFFRGEPVADVGGMKGLRMRSPEANVWVRMFELMGARPTPVTWGEVYTAMQTGVADGLESPGMAALDMKFNEVTKSVVQTRHMFAPMSIVMNKGRFTRLSADHQKAIGAAATEACRWSSTTLGEPGELEAVKTMQAKGMRVVAASNPQAWTDAVKPLWNEVAKDADSQKLLKLLVETK
jgi:tripartite ATP-independent transporter DctP family solute receptor